MIASIDSNIFSFLFNYPEDIDRYSLKITVPKFQNYREILLMMLQNFLDVHMKRKLIQFDELKLCKT